jgi:hypothetical protein
MSGCLSLPFRIALLALLVLGGFVAWSYRREIKRQLHQWTADSAGTEASRGSSDPALAPDVRRRIESLGRAGADSVVLSAADVASLAQGLVERMVPRAVDSLEIRLDTDDVEVRALVDTRQIPVSLGPLAGIVKDREYLEVGGRLLFRRTGVAEWQVDRVRVRGLPIPRELFGRVLQRFSSGNGAGVISFTIPRTLSGLRVTPLGVTLYGTGGAQ